MLQVNAISTCFFADAFLQLAHLMPYNLIYTLDNFGQQMQQFIISKEGLFVQLNNETKQEHLQLSEVLFGHEEFDPLTVVYPSDEQTEESDDEDAPTPPLKFSITQFDITTVECIGTVEDVMTNFTHNVHLIVDQLESVELFVRSIALSFELLEHITMSVITTNLLTQFVRFLANSKSIARDTTKQIAQYKKDVQKIITNERIKEILKLMFEMEKIDTELEKNIPRRAKMPLEKRIEEIQERIEQKIALYELNYQDVYDARENITMSSF